MARRDDEIDYPRLGEAVCNARRVMEIFRKERYAMVEQAAGFHYTDASAKQPVYVNMMSMFQKTIGRALIARNPRVMLSTKDTKKRPAVNACEDWVNDEIERMKLAGTLQRITLDALYSVGIAKVALADPGTAAVKSWRLKAGQPFVDHVDLDDFVFDVFARDFTEVAYMGHRYRVPLRVAKKMFKRKRGEQLGATVPGDYNAQGDERIGVIGRNTQTTRAEFEDMIDLWELYLPRHGLVVTLQDEAVNTQAAASDLAPLKVQKWLGPIEGPYVIQGFEMVPGNPMPKGAIHDIYDLHLALNVFYRKLNRQAMALKKTLPVSGGQSEDAQRLKQAADGEMFQCDNPEKLKELVTGGPDAGLGLWAQHINELADRFGGNLSLLGGLGPQSKTAKQDEMLNANSSRMMQDMQENTVTFTAEVLRRLLWYWWNHPEKVMRATKTLETLPDVSVTRVVKPKFAPPSENYHRRGGPVPQLTVDPYSLTHKTPQQRLAFLKSLVAELMPLMPLLQQQGVVFNANVYLALNAKYADEPDVQRLFSYQEPAGVETPGGGDGGDGGLPSNTTRTYERRSVGADSPAAQGAEQKTAMMGMAAQQAAQQAAPVG